MNATYLLHMEHLKRVAQRKIGMARQHVQQARTLRELVRAADPSLPPELRAMRASLPDASTLRREFELRGTEITQDQVAGLEKIARESDKQTFERELNRLRTQEWVYLRGHLPACFRYVEREAQRLRHEVARELDVDAQPSQRPRP